MIDKINILQGSNVFNESMHSTESQRLNESMINKFIDLNFQVHSEMENIERAIDNLVPFQQRVTEATTEQEEQRITKLFEENYKAVTNQVSQVQKKLKEMEDFQNLQQDQQSQEFTNNKTTIQSNYQNLQKKVQRLQAIVTEF